MDDPNGKTTELYYKEICLPGWQTEIDEIISKSIIIMALVIRFNWLQFLFIRAFFVSICDWNVPSLFLVVTFKLPLNGGHFVMPISKCG